MCLPTVGHERSKTLAGIPTSFWQGCVVVISLLSGMIASGLMVGCSGGDASPTPDTGPALTVHYYRALGDYSGVAVKASGDTTEPANTELPVDGTDAFGSYFRIGLAEGASTITFTVVKDGVDDLGNSIAVDLASKGDEVWVFSGDKTPYFVAPEIPAKDQAIIYYVRGDGIYDNWGLHVWQDTTEVVTWQEPLPITGTDSFGAFWKVGLKDAAGKLGFIIHQGDTKDPGPDQFLFPAEQGYRIWRLQDDATLYTHPIPASNAVKIDGSRAMFVSRDTIAWELGTDLSLLEGHTFALRTSPDGSIKVTEGVVAGGESLTLTLDPAGLPTEIREQNPYLSTYEALKLSAEDIPKVADILKGQLVITHADADGKLAAATGPQISGVLDDLFAYSGPLGITFSEGIPTLRLWAPTARSVSLKLFDDAADATPEDHALSAENGVWSVVGTSDWKGKYFVYDVEVYVPSEGRVIHNSVTDPYSVALSPNSLRSILVDLEDESLKPGGWDAHTSPVLNAMEDASLYELHVRDFSISDPTVPEALRGTWLAFTETDSDGMQHLQLLADAGLNHVHLLPAFDIATVNENRDEQLVTADLSSYAPDSSEQQAAVSAIADEDGFNWGYDPYHYNVPEGSYSTNPDGAVRTLEFRQMVQALHSIGMRVVMDVVYNHTTAAGQSDKSVLDKIVPGYYHRLDEKGYIATSTCCQNTATEHKMMEKLMIDSALLWAQAYRVDGFRFDLMGHHMKANLLNLEAALKALSDAQTKARGIAADATIPYTLYGEGWDFGEVAGNARGVNATQKNMAGTGIGTFNDRIRDAVRGGGPFDSGEALQKQGFASGLYVNPNSYDQGDEVTQEANLLKLMDQMRVGLTGNLKDYVFEDRYGYLVTGAEVDYNGAPTGYTLDPQEAISYVEAHDNQTLFDIFQYKLPAETTMGDRLRAHSLAISVVALGQGVPFYHAGMEMLRSKSLDRNSYNSGDWFNRLDFSYQTSNFGVGLPMEADNGENWAFMKPLLADPSRKPEAADIETSVMNFVDWLKIRNSSPLFRLGTAERVMERLKFLNTGPTQIPGLVVMVLSDRISGQPDLDPNYEQVVVLFNAQPEEVSFSVSEYLTTPFILHPIQAEGSDEGVKESGYLTGTFTVPALTTAVFVERELLLRK